MNSHILIPYARLCVSTYRALGPWHERCHFAKMDGPQDYGRTLDMYWRLGCDLVVVEHDIIIHQLVIPEFDACPEPWCVFPYANTDRYQGHLGCTRFRSELMKGLPDAIQHARSLAHASLPAGHWVGLDGHLRDYLQSYGYTRHVHLPPVGHLNLKQQVVPDADRGWCHWPARVWPDLPD